MKYLLQFKIFGKVFRFTHPFDNIVEYQFGGISSTTIARNGKNKTVIMDNQHCFSRIMFGLYILKGNPVLRIVKFITNRST
ncbi:MAG: hypothetical protein ACFFG0_06355 [Candidatus Thorarchaeota archaeon]